MQEICEQCKYCCEVRQLETNKIVDRCFIYILDDEFSKYDRACECFKNNDERAVS